MNDSSGNRGGAPRSGKPGGGYKGGGSDRGKPGGGYKGASGRASSERRDERDGGRRWRDGDKPEEERELKGPAAMGKQLKPPPPRLKKPEGAKEARRPNFPDDAEVTVSKGTRREIGRHLTNPDLKEKVLIALSIAGEFIDAGDGAGAREYLEWAKEKAPRSMMLREALAVARYLDEDYAGAITEVRAYQRITGNTDQNHLLADCQRAVGRDAAVVAETVQAMDRKKDGEDRWIEGRIVWASALADGGDIGAGRAVLRPLVQRSDTPAEHDLRLWYVAGDLAAREGDQGEARKLFGWVSDVDEEMFDVGVRLSELAD